MISTLIGEYLRLVEYPLVQLATIALVSGYVYYQILVVRRAILHSKSGSEFTKSLIAGMPILRENYKPTFWCFESRMQTVFSSLLRRTLPDINYKREVLKLFDGGEVCLDWIEPDNEDSNDASPICLFLPGLTGHSQSEYIKSFVNVARRQLGGRCVVFNFRGRGNHPLKTARTYCASNSEDLAAVIDHIKATYPTAQILALGVSLGGIILGNYLAKEGEAVTEKLEAAMLVSVCFDTFRGTESLEKKGLNRMLNRHLANCLVDSIKEAKDHFAHSTLWDLDEVFSSTTIRDFDERFTAKQFGYADYREYYNAARIKGKINQIKVPTLALNAEDDVFSPGETLPTDEAKQSDHVAILTTKYGGHIGFMEGALPTRFHFSDRVFEQFARSIFSKN